MTEKVLRLFPTPVIVHELDGAETLNAELGQYVRVSKGEGGQLVLHDPRMPELRMHAPGVHFAKMGPEVKAEIKPKAGLLILFPAWLSHSVEPWEGSGDRISVAMNIRAGKLQA
jgi:hypothetical protein